MADQHGRRKPNAEFLREHFLREGRLTENQALALLRQATEMLTTEPNVLKVKSPVTGMSLSHFLRLLGVELLVSCRRHTWAIRERLSHYPYQHLDPDLLVRPYEDI